MTPLFSIIPRSFLSCHRKELPFLSSRARTAYGVSKKMIKNIKSKNTLRKKKPSSVRGDLAFQECEIATGSDKTTLAMTALIRHP